LTGGDYGVFSKIKVRRAEKVRQQKHWQQHSRDSNGCRSKGRTRLINQLAAIVTTAMASADGAARQQRQPWQKQAVAAALTRSQQSK